MPEQADVQRRFLQRVEAAARDGSLLRLRLARPEDDTALLRVDGRLATIRGEPQLSFVWHYRTRDETHNIALDGLTAFLAARLGTQFRSASLGTTTHDIELGFSRRGRPLLHTARRAAAAGSGSAAAGPGTHGPMPPVGPAPAREPGSDGAPAHNRERHRHLSPHRPFLAALGVTDRAGRVLPTMASKWRQIDKFVEIVSAALREAGELDPARVRERPLTIIDQGAGKGYLTFALHDYLTDRLKLPVRTVGIERRADLVALCNRIAGDHGMAGLSFRQGEIADSADIGEGDTLDVMIALHACDTATDDALHRGVLAGAGILVASPCCHKELRPQLLAPHPLAPLLRHGVHRGEMAEMVTDTMRALLLETRGYSARIFEFVSLEHTARNRMILATRSADGGDPQAARAQFEALKAFHAVHEQRLERLLAAA